VFSLDLVQVAHQGVQPLVEIAVVADVDAAAPVAGLEAGVLQKDPQLRCGPGAGAKAGIDDHGMAVPDRLGVRRHVGTERVEHRAQRLREQQRQ
jgi:hypothetical protein